MPPKVHSQPFGSVAVPDDLPELVGPRLIDDAIIHLRLGGGSCWLCNDPIHASDRVSMVAHLTSTGDRLGFLHYRCAPPQILDERRSRQASLRMAGYLKDASTEAQAFALLRDYPTPHGLLVVSAETPSLAQEENGDTTTPWLSLVLEQGFTPLGPDVLDATPGLLPGWRLDVAGDQVVCGHGDHQLYVGALDIPDEWRSALQEEGQCVVVAVGLGISSTELGNEALGALNALAGRGLVACAGVATGTLST